MNISVTGYFGAGSSAVFDLLLEYSGNRTGLKEEVGGYEHNILYYPGGIFDLEDKLLLANDIHRSDEAISTFVREMKRLNDNNFGWYGSFKAMYGNKFNEILDEFISDLSGYEIPVRYYGQCEKVIFNPFKIPLQVAARVLLGRHIYKWGRQFVYNNAVPSMKVTFPTEDEFYGAAKKFVSSYMEMFQDKTAENTIYDRLLLSHNFYRMPNYFGEDFRIINVERDVRDIYILNKYIWKEIHAGIMYPSELSEFIDYWKRTHDMEKPCSDKRILNIRFEDLVYDYEKTVEKIEKHCNLNPDTHIRKQTLFVPEKSIKNTQSFRLKSEWQEEIRELEKAFPQYLYDFLYDIDTSVGEMFDDSRTVRKKGLINIIRNS